MGSKGGGGGGADSAGGGGQGGGGIARPEGNGGGGFDDGTKACSALENSPSGRKLSAVEVGTDSSAALKS